VIDSTRECVGDHVVLSRDVSHVGGELGDDVQVVELPRGAVIPFLLEGIGERFMVREYGEMTCFQHVTEVAHGLLDSQEFKGGYI
jgi:hypothetical protein